MKANYFGPETHKHEMRSDVPPLNFCMDGSFIINVRIYFVDVSKYKRTLLELMCLNVCYFTLIGKGKAFPCTSLLQALMVPGS
jgi:hypothetical protein